MRAVILLLSLAAVGASGESCEGRCGVDDGSSGCQCNSLCSNFDDCCSDYEEVCMSCKGRCGEAYLPSRPCHCNDECTPHNTCCDDYADVCGELTDASLRTLTEEMFEADVNAVGSQLTLDLQGKGSSGDLASGPLFVSVPDSAMTGPTISLLQLLQDNYEPSVSVSEDEDAAEVAEQDAFLDAVMNTQVMQLAQTFLVDKGLLSGSLKDKLKEMWFAMYPRSGQILGSSGFEHVFVGELKDGKVSGFHNWVHSYREEEKGTFNYEGWSTVIDLGDKGGIHKNHFEWLNEPKRIGSFFVGISPELEMATFTVCFLARPNGNCSVQMNGRQFLIKSFEFDYKGKVLVGSAYPNI